MSKEAAQQIAATYQAKGKVRAHRVSLRGKSDKEIADMLQSALAKKDYTLANQTLIEFERKRVKDDAQASANSSH